MPAWYSDMSDGPVREEVTRPDALANAPESRRAVVEAAAPVRPTRIQRSRDSSVEFIPRAQRHVSGEYCSRSGLLFEIDKRMLRKKHLIWRLR